MSSYIIHLTDRDSPNNSRSRVLTDLHVSTDPSNTSLSTNVFQFEVHAQMNLDTLQQTLKNLLRTTRVIVGVFDDKKTVFFPLSFLLHSPRTFSTRQWDVFSVVFEDSTFMNAITSAAVSASCVEEDDDEIEEEDVSPQKNVLIFDDSDSNVQLDDSSSDEYNTETDVNEFSKQDKYDNRNDDNDNGEGYGDDDDYYYNENDEVITALSEDIPLEFIDAHLKMIIDEVHVQSILKQHTISQVFHTLSLHANSDDNISRASFITSMSYLNSFDPKTNEIDEQTLIYERIYDSLYPNVPPDNSGGEEERYEVMNIYHISRFLSMFCSHGDDDDDESIRIVYNLFDFNRDGLVTLTDAYNCFFMMLKTTLDLFPDIIFNIENYPLERIVQLLTNKLFYGKAINNSGNTILSFSYFHQWYLCRDSMIFLLTEAVPNPRMLKNIKSTVSSFQDARNELGLYGIKPETLMNCLSHYASEQERASPLTMPSSSLHAKNEVSEEKEDFKFISRRGVFAAILLASKMESSENIFSASWKGLYIAEIILCQIFGLYDISQAGYVDRNDIYAGLSVYCCDTFQERVSVMFATSEALKVQHIVYTADKCAYFQSFVKRSQMIEYLLAVLKSVLLFSEYKVKDDIIQTLAVRMISDGLSQRSINCQRNGLVSVAEFARWLKVVINVPAATGEETEEEEEEEEESQSFLPESSSVFGTTQSVVSDTSGDESAASSSVLSIVSQELQAVKSIMGFLGFTAEDVMDMLGEVSCEGMIFEFNWLQAVSHMCEFNNLDDEEDSRLDEALLFASRIFDSLAGLYPPIKSASGDRAISYSLLLSAITILCDSSIEDKLLTAFMVLSDTTSPHPEDSVYTANLDKVVSYASVSNVTDYFRGVFAVLCAVSPSVQDMTLSMGFTPDGMAVATMQCAINQNGLTEVSNNGFDVDQFYSLAWACVEM